jgi:hypothetical protein
MVHHRCARTATELLIGVVVLLGCAMPGSPQFPASVPGGFVAQDAAQIESLRADPDAARRREVARALGLRGGLNVIPILAQAAAFDSDRQVRIAAGDAIALIRRRGAGEWILRPPPGAHNYRALVESWYQLFLHRPADPDGLRDYVGRLRRGIAPEDVQAGFLGSEEYYRLQGSRPRRWVAALYADVLDRSPTPREINGWIETLARNGGSREATAAEFLRSAKPELAQRKP